MSYPNDPNVTYDRSLLSRVPDPTRAEKQEGYNFDLLDEGCIRRATTPPDSGPVPTDQQPLTDGYSPGAVALAKEGQLENGAKPAAVTKRPWYRTRWGITAIIVIVVIIGAVVGGVVGGTHHSSHKNDNSNGNVGSGNPTTNNGTISSGNGTISSGNVSRSPSPTSSTSSGLTFGPSSSVTIMNMPLWTDLTTRGVS